MLAREAFERGDLARAEQRFRRALDSDPAAARAGLGQVALARGDGAAARRWLEQALARDPASVPALLGLASLAREGGDPAQARALLDRALAAEPRNASTHAALFDLTGLAPRPLPAEPAALLALAHAHPYDPAVQVAVARLALAQGKTADASRLLQSALALGDLDPAAAREAFSELARLDPAWRARTFVPVSTWADDSVTSHPGWEFQVRWIWQVTSLGLDRLLHVVFVPVRLGSFAVGGESASLTRVGDAFRRRGERDPPHGIVAAFTARPPPPTPGQHRLGVATFGGRHLVVRIDPGSERSHTLAHELLHLYGAVHANPGVVSIMNPSGDAWTLDAPNAEIVEDLRQRHFGPGGWDRNIFPYIDLEKTTDAYLRAIRSNLALRNAGIQEALAEAAQSRFVAASKLREAAGLDPHLGDVCSFTAELLWRGERRVEATVMMETAARLYGPRTPRGEAAEKRAALLRAAARRAYGLD